MGSGCSTHSLLPQTDTPSAKPGPGPGHHSARIASTTNTGGGSQEIPSEETAIETFDKENTMKQLKQDKAARRAEREKNGEVARSPSHSHGARSRDRSRERSSHKSHRERSDRGARSRERSRDRGSGAPSRSHPHDSDEEMEDHEHQSHRKGSRRNKKDRDQDKLRDREEKRRDDHDRAASPLQFIQPNHIDTGGGDGDDEMEVMELDHKLPDTHNNNNHNNRNNNKSIKPAQPSYKPPASSLLKKGLVDRNFAQESSNAEIFVQLSRDRLKAGLPAAPASSGWT